jgi:hypothetical protein
MVLTLPKLEELPIADTKEHEVNVHAELGIVKYCEIDTAG